MSAIQKYRQEATELRKQLTAQADELRELRELRLRIQRLFACETRHDGIQAEALVHAQLERLEQMEVSQ